MKDSWNYPIMIFHRKKSMEIILNKEETSTFVQRTPRAFVGEDFVDVSGCLWRVSNITSVKGVPPYDGWRLPFLTPGPWFVRELGYEIEATKIRKMSLIEIKAKILEGVESSSLWYEVLDMPDWKDFLNSYNSVEEIFKDFTDGTQR